MTFAVTVVVATITLALAQKLLLGSRSRAKGFQFRNQLIMTGLGLSTLIAVVLTIPLPEESQRSNLLSLVSVLLSAAVALSSTTFLGNMLAGLMLRAIKSHRPGDFIRVGEHFGRVSEQGLVHTEIQTEDSDLMTLPNLYLVTNPVKVVRPSATIVTATVSLGYDVSRGRVKDILIDAARRAELEEPFVHVLDLGDFSVTYSVAGKLTEVKQLISARSRLRCEMLDALHGGGIEIVSPTFMNTRPVQAPVIPEVPILPTPESPQASAEELIFDKAEEAHSRELLRAEIEQLDEQLTELTEQLKTADETDRPRLNADQDTVQRRRDTLATELEELEAAE